MQIIATKQRGTWLITIDENPMRLHSAAKSLKISREAVGNALRRGGAESLLELVAHYKLCRELGAIPGTRLYEKDGCYAWSRLIVDNSGVCVSHAYRLLRDWAAGEIDEDDLFRPPLNKKALNKKRAEGISKRRGDWNLGKMNPRKDIKSLPRPTKHDRECAGQSTEQCLPGSGRGAGGSCRY